MADTTQNQEPSMEEILASIRKIISEDGATVEPAPPVEDILDLTEEVKPEPAPEPAPAPVQAVQEAAMPIVEMEDHQPEPMPEPEPVPPPVPEAPAANLDLGDSLLAETTVAASASMLGGLASMMKSGGHGVSSFPIGEGSRTLESMVLEIIKPYLKEWLDQNLPTLVERVVQKEIQKITRTLQ